MEVWKELQINPNYHVSNYGNVRRRLVKRKEFMYLKPDINKGYKRVQIFYTEKNEAIFAHAKGSTYKRFLVHRLVAELFCEKRTGMDIVNHIDCNPSNNHYSNLEWTDYSGNLKHSYLTGNSNAQGENNNLSKLTDNKVILIRGLKANCKKTNRWLANLFSVSESLISMVVNRKIWTHC